MDEAREVMHVLPALRSAVEHVRTSRNFGAMRAAAGKCDAVPSLRNIVAYETWRDAVVRSETFRQTHNHLPWLTTDQLVELVWTTSFATTLPSARR